MVHGGAAVAAGPDYLTEGRAAVAVITPDLVRLIRAGADRAPNTPAIGHWGIGDVACHLTHAVRIDTDALAGRPLPPTPLNPRAIAVMTDAELVADPERDLRVLADRAEALLEGFQEVCRTPAADEVTWLGGVRLPASAVACHLLEEMLVHGHDFATATGGSWRIDPAHATLALAGAAAPIVNAADPLSFVDAERAAGFRGRFEARLRGHHSFTFVLDDGLRIEDGASGPFDAHWSADPGTALLLTLGRVNPVRAVLAGKLIAWGRRPWRLRRLLEVITPP